MQSKNHCFLSMLGMLIVFNATAQSEYPAKAISNQALQVKIYLPDAEKGFYRSTRFDWSGVIGSLRYRGHEYFDPWLETHDPMVHEAITGPVEAFAPIGFEQAEPGASFLVIGVGYLEKPDDNPYRFATTYRIVNPGSWKVRHKKDRIKFKHTLVDGNGISYQYRKTVKLVKDQPKMVLQHSLRNTGTKPIETTVYNHNFFVIDQEPTGPGIVTKFAIPVQAEGRGFGEMITTRENTLTFLRNLHKGESVYTAGVTNTEGASPGYDFRIENRKSGAGVRITADRPLQRLAYWACHSTACPEPFIALDINPGETQTWEITYEFYEFQPK